METPAIDGNPQAQPPAPTPILNRVVSLPSPIQGKRSLHKKALPLLVGGGIGVLLTLDVLDPAAMLEQAFSVSGAFDDKGPVLLMFIFLVCTCAGIVIHETGHFVAGRIAGLELNLIRFGPLQINPPFHLSWHWREAGLTGFTSMLPKEGNVEPQKILIMVIGGPGANLLSAGVVLAFRGFWDAAPAVAILCVLSALMLGVGSLVPTQGRKGGSDGKRIWMLLSQKERADRWLALFQLSAAVVRGVDFENLPPEALRRATSFKDDSLDTVAAHAIAYGTAYFANEIPKAAQLLETCLAHSSRCSLIMREAMISDAAVFQARKMARLDLAQEWLDDLPSKPQFPGLRLRAEAAILEAGGDIRGALDKLNETQRALRSIVNQAQRDVSLRALHRWQSELQSQSTP